MKNTRHSTGGERGEEGEETGGNFVDNVLKN